MPTTQNLAQIGWKAVIGIGIEVTAGTAVAPSVYLPVTDINVAATNDLTVRAPMRRSKGQAQSGPGQFVVAGSFTAEAHVSELGVLFGLAFGTDTSASSGSGYSHTFSLASPLNTFTLSVDYGSGTIHQYVGCKVDNLTLSGKPKGVIEVKVGVKGVNDVPVGGSLSPTYTTPDIPYTFENISTATISASGIGVLPFRATDFTFDMKNNIQPAWYTGTNRFAGQMNETETVISGSCTIEYDDETWFQLVNELVAGEIALAIPHPVSPYAMYITIPNALITTAPISATKKAVLTHAVKFEAFATAAGQQNDLVLALITLASNSYVT